MIQIEPTMMMRMMEIVEIKTPKFQRKPFSLRSGESIWPERGPEGMRGREESRFSRGIPALIFPHFFRKSPESKGIFWNPSEQELKILERKTVF